jgi:putative nucleotidyltransferase with HDIG domain
VEVDVSDKIVIGKGCSREYYDKQAFALFSRNFYNECMFSSKMSTLALLDGNARHARELNAHFNGSYHILHLTDSKTLMSDLHRALPSLIILCEDYPSPGSVQVLRELKQDPSLKNIPLIYIAETDNFTALAKIKMMGVTAIFIKPYNRAKLGQTISAELNKHIETQWQSLPEAPRKALRQSVDVFNSIADTLGTGDALPFTAVKMGCEPLVEAVNNNDFKSILNGVRSHDDYTYAHSMRVATMLSLLGHAAGFNTDEKLLLASGGLLHDVGKMFIPHAILNKPGRLTEDEFEVMKSHVPHTIEYLKKSSDIPHSIFIIAEQHHEKLDGTGYPFGLAGSQLNELARMAAVVDVFSALTDRRIYKDPMEPEKAITIMEDEMARHLDSTYIKLFKTILYDADLLNEDE